MISWDLVTNLLIFILSGIVLSRSASWVVSSITKLSRHFKVSSFVISFIVMSVATSLPELLISVVSAVQDQPEFALGTVIGSNIANLTIIAGISIILAGSISTRGLIEKKYAYNMAIITVLLVGLLVDGVLSRSDGIILLLAYGFYIRILLFGDIQKSNTTKRNKLKNTYKTLGVFIGGLTLLIASSRILVSASENIALALDMPIILIGLILVALGTSIPELAFNIIAIREGHKNMVMGGLIGSVVANSAFILGVVAIIQPIQIEHIVSLDAALATLVVTLVIFLKAMQSNRKFTKAEGLTLIFIYIAYIFSGYIGVGIN